MNADFPDNKQRYAVCASSWRDAHGNTGLGAAPSKATMKPPAPNDGESASAFHDRCMGHPSMTQYKDEKFRAQVCQTIWAKPKPAAAAPGKAVAPADCMPQTDETAAEFMDRCMAGGDTQAACMMAWMDSKPMASGPGKATAPPPTKPAPASGESRDAFMGRCMRDPSMKDHGNPMAACVALWDAGGKSLEGMVTKSTVRLNTTGESKARGLVDAGKVSDAAWSFSADDGNTLLGGADGTDWAAYAAYHLGEDTAEHPKTRARYKYPFGKGGQVYLSALRAIRSRASQQGATSVFDAAGRLLDAATKKQNAIPARATVPAAVERGLEMKWMPTHLEVKGLNEGERVLSGIATTPSVDHMGDIVDSMGARYKEPVSIPLLWMHRHDQPVGVLTHVDKTPKGIRFQARIAKVEEPGILRDRVDMVWQSVRAGLVRGVSIGFTPIPGEYEPIKSASGVSQGVKFRQWRWHELSLVSIPAQEDAQIQVIRALDRAAMRAADEECRAPVYTPPEKQPHAVQAVPQMAPRQDAIVQWINDFANKREWHRTLDARGLRYQNETDLAKHAAVNIRLRQPTGDITQEQIRFEAWELRRLW